MRRVDASQVVTYDQGLTNPRWLGELGVVTGLQYSDACPGGNDVMQCVLGSAPRFWDRALAPGRIVRIYRGCMRVWEGIMQLPQPSDAGWQLNAIGAGHYGDNFTAIDSGGFATSDAAVAAAISRGMRWTDPGISDTGMWLGQPPNNASLQITDWLNQITSPGPYTWHVGPWNELQVFPIPTAVTRVLVATSPAARTLAGYINALYAYYEATDDTTTSATYATAEAENDPSIAVHGRYEAGWDISSVGLMTSGTAAADAAAVLSRYQAASFASSFAVGAGQYLTTGGTPVDLGCERAGEVVRLVLADGGYGGDYSPLAACTFVVGEFEYDDDQGVASVTPFQSVRSDMSSLLQAASSLLTPPTMVS